MSILFLIIHVIHVELAEKQQNNGIREVGKVGKLDTSAKCGLDILRMSLWYAGDMLEGKCRKCGTYRSGWALLNPRHQTCPNCGVALEIKKDGYTISRGYSPFTAETYKINQFSKSASR